MKWTIVGAFVAAVTGVLFGLGLTIAELGAYNATPVDFGANENLTRGRRNQPLPKVVLPEGEKYDFGTMKRDTTRSHDFVIRNDGDAPLELTTGETSCKCTISELDNDTLAPGSSTTIRMEWTAITDVGPFRQTAQIKTNDPRRPEFELVIEGRVVLSHRVAPEELAFNDILVSQPTTATVHIYAYDEPQIGVKDYEFLNAATAEYFDFAIEEMPADQVGQEKDAKAGKIGKVTVKPGLPLGEIHQTIRLTLDLPEEPKADILIQGRVVGDITVMGPIKQWNDEYQLLRLGRVKSDQGAKSQGMYFLVKGEHREGLNFKVKSVEPEFLKVHIDPPQETTSASLVRVPFTVEAPPGSPPGEHNGTLNRPFGKVEVETGHPTSPRLLFNVSLVVER